MPLIRISKEFGVPTRTNYRNDALARIHRKVNLDSPSALQLEVEVSIHDHNPPGERALYGLTPTDIRHLAYAGTGANRQSDKQTGWPED